MGIKQPNKVSIARAIYLCAVAIVAPARFAELERADTAILETKPNAPQIERVLIVRRALGYSLLLVLFSGAAGVLVARVSEVAVGPACTSTIAYLQMVGAMLLLWATLAVRGWDILTFASVTLSERVNQWIYRLLYCCGTGVLVWSVAWHTTNCG